MSRSNNLCKQWFLFFVFPFDLYFIKIHSYILFFHHNIIFLYNIRILRCVLPCIQNLNSVMYSFFFYPHLHLKSQSFITCIVLTDEKMDKTSEILQSSISSFKHYINPKEPSRQPRQETDFSHLSLNYVIDATDFLNNLHKQRLSADTISSSCAENNDDSSDEFDPSQDLFAASKRKSQNSKHPTASVVKEILINSSLPVDDSSMLTSKLVHAYDSYHLSRSITLLASSTCHQSYIRLLQICAMHLMVEKQTLDEQVSRLELVYMAEREYMDQRAMFIQKFFRNKNF